MSSINQAELKSKLISGEISGEDAFAIIFSNKRSTKPWDTKEWKEKRNQKIGKQCEKCGSDKQPMVIQHTWHPPAIATLYAQIQRENNIQDWMKNNEERFLCAFPKTVDVCPKCKSAAIKFKKDNRYACNSNSGGIRCNHIFDAPEKAISWQDRKEAKKQLYKEFNTVFDISRKVAILSIENHQRYMDMLDEDIKTLCRKCAFIEDKTFSLDRFLRENL